MPEQPIDLLPAPVKHLANVAANADPRSLAGFIPSPTHVAVVGALLNFMPSTMQELADKSNLPLVDLYAILDDPVASSWIMQQSADRFKVGLASVYARLYQMAMTSTKAQWVELFLKRFDPEFQRRTGADAGQVVNNYLAVVANMSDTELRSLLTIKRQTILGEACLAQPPSLPKNSASS